MIKPENLESARSIIRQRGESFQVEINRNGRRVRQSFESRAESDASANTMRGEIRTEGEGALALKAGDRIEALRMLKAFSDRQAQDDAVNASDLLKKSITGYKARRTSPSPAIRAVTVVLNEGRE